MLNVGEKKKNKKRTTDEVLRMKSGRRNKDNSGPSFIGTLNGDVHLGTKLFELYITDDRSCSFLTTENSLN